MRRSVRNYSMGASPTNITPSFRLSTIVNACISRTGCISSRTLPLLGSGHRHSFLFLQHRTSFRKLFKKPLSDWLQVRWVGASVPSRFGSKITGVSCQKTLVQPSVYFMLKPSNSTGAKRDSLREMPFADIAVN